MWRSYFYYIVKNFKVTTRIFWMASRYLVHTYIHTLRSICRVPEVHNYIICTYLIGLHDNYICIYILTNIRYYYRWYIYGYQVLIYPLSFTKGKKVQLRVWIALANKTSSDGNLSNVNQIRDVERAKERERDWGREE